VIHVSVSPRNKESGYYNKHDSASGTAAQICCMSLIKMYDWIRCKIIVSVFFQDKHLQKYFRADTMFFIKLEDDCYFKKFGMRK